MNPPSALHGAMNRDRKPFTYTPGGLDLSQIKSERMAKRLMRNAMDQGVPEHPTNIQTPPPTMSTTLNVPNYNCLPVQVFPTFPLPANPKALLKTRSNSVDQKDRRASQTEIVMSPPEDLTTNIQAGTKQCYTDDRKLDLPQTKPRYENNNNNESWPSYEYNVAPIVHPYPNYGSNSYIEPVFRNVQMDTGELINFEDLREPYYQSNQKKSLIDDKSVFSCEPAVTNTSDMLISINNPVNNSHQALEQTMETDIKQKEVKVVKQQAKSGNITEQQNGDMDVQAAVTVKLPGKKSAAKTETKVEVVKKVLPDGSVEEVKTTTTKTTVDGKTEIRTKTETTIIPKEDDYEEEEVVEEEEEEEQENCDKETINNRDDNDRPLELNDHGENVSNEKDLEEENILEDESSKNITKREESSESSLVKKVTIVQSTRSQENSEVEEDEEEEEQEDEQENEQENEKQEEQKDIGNQDILIESKKEEIETNEVLDESVEDLEGEQGRDETDDANQGEQQLEEENEVANADDARMESEPEEIDKTTDKKEIKTEEVKEVGKIPTEITNDEKLTDGNKDKKDSTDFNQNKEVVSEESFEKRIESTQEENCNQIKETPSECTQENKEEIIIEVKVLKPELSAKEEEKSKESSTNELKSSLQTEHTSTPLREPSVPLEKVEDVEIKPIGQIISKSHTENTEIITTSIDKPATGLSTQTAYNRIENIVTVNRTTKTLDHAYEQIAQHTVPIVNTSFAPNLTQTSPQLSRPYQSVYAPEPQSERRHSLLLDRLSVDRQMPPTELYQNNYQFANQTFDQTQLAQEPQSEVLTVSNVKPSTITKNQQWYQQIKKDDDVTYNTPASTLNVPSQQSNPQKLQTQHQQYLQPQPQASYQSQPQYQPSYIESQDSYKTTSNTSSSYQQNTYPSYAPKPTTWVNNNVMSRNTPTPIINKPPSQFSYTEKDSSEMYSKPTQQFSSSYVPPPWEQDSSFATDNINQTYYTPPTTNQFTNNTSTKWTPTPTVKFSKPKPTSYVPPAPNQSFVKPVSSVDLPKLPGRKTYYSEYERRYISVPESTYIPTENKFQAQPDPSPQYYYDNNEPSEMVEHEWRKELREFSEKTQTQSQSEQTTVKPPWEEDPKYYVPKVTTEYTPTPTWSQTLRPNTWRERSFESEFGRSKELHRTNTLGRGRPQSSYIKSNIGASIPERPRGVSVDRYNSNTYKSPVHSEHPPVVSHTLDPSIGSKTYHNSNVPAYHSRASAEPREQSAAIPQARQWGEARAPPIQSRSFKYLQWITGTED